MSERFAEVRVLSARTDRRGNSRLNQAGEGTVLSDDPDTVHITATTWYGEWPVDETDIPQQRAKRLEKARIAEELAVDRAEALEKMANIPGLADGSEAYKFLIEKLTEQGVSWKGDSTVLVRKDGSYTRLPTENEAAMDFMELEMKGLVEKDDDDE